MSFIFGSSKLPSVQTSTIPQVQAEESIKEEEKKKVQKGAIGKKTLLTGAQGVTEAAPVARKYLLGE